MPSRFQRMVILTIALVSLGEALLLHWAMLTTRGYGLSIVQALLALSALTVVNRLVFPLARRRIHATGLELFFTRSWILGSVASLLTGLLLAGVFLLVGGSGWLLGEPAAARTVAIWCGGLMVAIGFGSVLWGASVGSHRVRVDAVTLPLRSSSPDHHRLRIAHVTDLHIGPLLRPPRLREFIRRINELEPDVIAVTGDIFDFDPAYVPDMGQFCP
jgi:hypothetical protein